MLWWKLQRLKSKDPKTRVRIVDEMVASGKASVVEHIVSALAEDDDWEVRVAAAKGLGVLRDARAFDPLVAGLRDKQAEVRCACAQSLRHLGDTRAIEPLLPCLSDSHPHARW